MAEILVEFPLIHYFSNRLKDKYISFKYEENNGKIKFKPGVYLISGENGTGKTIFLTKLALQNNRLMSDENIKMITDREYDYRKISVSESDELREKHYSYIDQNVYLPGGIPMEDFLSYFDNYVGEKDIDGKLWEEISKRKWNELSGGQQQEAYITLMLNLKKKLIFLDEPMNNFDRNHQRKFIDKRLKTLFESVDEGKIVFIIEHRILRDTIIGKHPEWCKCTHKIITKIEGEEDKKIFITEFDNKVICQDWQKTKERFFNLLNIEEEENEDQS